MYLFISLFFYFKGKGSAFVPLGKYLTLGIFSVMSKKSRTFAPDLRHFVSGSILFYIQFMKKHFLLATIAVLLFGMAAAQTDRDP